MKSRPFTYGKGANAMAYEGSMLVLDRVMNETGSYFCTLVEKRRKVLRSAVGNTLTFADDDPLEGSYSTGDLVRIHGAYTVSNYAFGAGEVYRVVAADGNTVTVDRPIHTAAPNLLLSFLEPPSDFLELVRRVETMDAAEQTGKVDPALASESIDGYSYSVRTGENGATGWRLVLADWLGRYSEPQPTKLYYTRNARAWQQVRP